MLSKLHFFFLVTFFLFKYLAEVRAEMDILQVLPFDVC